MSEDLTTVTEPTKPGRGRRLLTAVLPAVLVLGAIGGGVTYTAVTVGSADRSAPTVAWEEPKTTQWDKDPAASASRGRASTPLSKLLLPVPEGYVLGPDIESYGNDGELGGKEALALLKEEGKGLSGKKRRTYEKRVEKVGIQGIAVRSFASESNDVVVFIRVTQMKDKKRIREMFDIKKELFELFEFPKGPKISGHKNSVCFMVPEEKGLKKSEKSQQLEEMHCTAYDSEVEVTVSVAGTKPFDRAAAAKLVRQQLDHITSPGEYV